MIIKYYYVFIDIFRREFQADLEIKGLTMSDPVSKYNRFQWASGSKQLIIIIYYYNYPFEGLEKALFSISLGMACHR